MPRLRIAGRPNLIPPSLAAMIDHTFLKPFGTPADIEKLCQEAAEHRLRHGRDQSRRKSGSASGCSPEAPCALGPPSAFRWDRILRPQGLRDGRRAAQGAQEIDMVINLRALQSGRRSLVRREIRQMVQACRKAARLQRSFSRRAT